MIRIQNDDGVFVEHDVHCSTIGRLAWPTGPIHGSPGQRPGCRVWVENSLPQRGKTRGEGIGCVAPLGQKARFVTISQGVALGCLVTALQAAVPNAKRSLHLTTHYMD